MKIVNKIATWIIVICFPILLISSALGILVNNIGTYNYIIEEYNVQLFTGIDEIQLKDIYQHWIDYYNNKADSAQYEFLDSDGKYQELLSEKELIHLSDVKSLMQLDYAVASITIILFILSVITLVLLDKSRWQLLAKAVFRGGVLTIALFALIIVLSMCCFDQIFILFHEISFSNDFWILDPASDYLIMMFPGGFFYDVVIIAFCSILVTAIVCSGISLTMLKRKQIAV